MEVVVGEEGATVEEEETVEAAVGKDEAEASDKVVAVFALQETSHSFPDGSNTQCFSSTFCSGLWEASW